MSGQASLIDELPTLQRLALAYAPAAAHVPTLALLAFDTRLAAILRAAREPMLAQLRLAWWREQLRSEPTAWPAGEPLLAALRSWESRRDALLALVDGWEAMTGAAPLAPAALAGLAEARGDCFAALAELVGAGQDADAAARLGTNWSFADLAMRLNHADERRTAREMADRRDWRRTPLSPRLRPLVVLHGLAARSLRRGAEPGAASPLAMLAAIRLGLLGR